MNPVFGTRKRADEFHAMLEAQASHSGLPDTRYGDLLHVVATLRQAPPPVARPEFVSDLRSRLMLAAEGALAPMSAISAHPAPTIRRSPRERRIAAAVGGFAIVSATASMAVAAQTALPGDTLYPLKRAIESAEAGVQRGADDRGSMLLGNASGRLEEVGELSRADDQDATVIAETLQDFADQASEASNLLLSDYTATGRAASIEQLRLFTAESTAVLKSLESLIPDEARASLIEASMVVRQIDELALSACPSCSDLPLTEMPAFATSAVPTPLRNLLHEDRTASSEPIVKGSGTPASKGRSTGVAQQAPANEAAPVDPPTTPDPVLPTDTGGSTPDGSNSDDPLKNITSGASTGEDPIGDLITGTGEVVDQVLGGDVLNP